MRRAGIVMMGWLAINWLTVTTGYAAACPQDPQKQPSGDVPAKSVLMPPEEKPNPGIKLNIEEREASVTLPRNARQFGERFLLDQKGIWTSPAHLRWSDANWLVPLGGITAGFFVTDRDFSKHLSQNPTTISHYKTISSAGVGALVGSAGGMWLLGHVKHNSHWTETGFLSGEAALNSLVTVEALKYSLRRERPYVDNANGSFFQHGGTSFPSEHAAAAWSVAGVIAHEYPGPLTKIMAYGLASLVDYSRIRGQQHFPSDVLVGSIIGDLVAQNIYSRHHDSDLGGGEWRSISQLFRGGGDTSSANQGSPYVPLDSWIYPALDRLIGMGMIDSGFAGMRPWTRRECMRQLSEAEDKLGGTGSDNPEVSQLVEALEREFHSEVEATDDGTSGGAFRVESLYSRTEYISGTPLTDGYSFAQTQFDDFGRPYSQGWNTVNGFSTYATWGRWTGYVRAEEQSAPGIPALPLAAREAIQTFADVNQDGPHLPLQPGTPKPSVTQFQLLDTYVGLTLSDYEVSFGRQSLWWGTAEGGSLDLSDNIQPINMFRINRTTPLKLPSFLGWLGPVRAEFFLGQLAGHEFIFSPLGLQGQWGQALSQQPFIHGQNLSFRPTRNLEFGFYRTTIFGGEGYPFTLHSLGRSLISTSNTPAGDPRKPGKRTSALDFSYRLPYLRNWVSFYGEGMTYDQFSPIAYWDRASWRAGLFFSHIPLVPRLDFRVEGVYTDIPAGGGSIGPGAIYSNGTWRSGYTNNGYLIGDWVGRGGQGAQAWTNYWFNARDRLQFNFRHQKVSQEFIPGGGTLTDVGARGEVWLRHDLGVSVSVQYERWLFPVIQPGPERNITTSVGIEFQPQKIYRSSFHHGPQDAANVGDAN